MGWFKLFCKINLRQLQKWEFRTFPSDFVFKVLLSSRLTQLENQISHYENTALHQIRHRNMDTSSRGQREGGKNFFKWNLTS